MPHTAGQIIKKWMEPDFKFYINRKQDRKNYLLEDGRMRGEYLRACLDYIRWGAMNAVSFPMPVRELIGFIHTWMDLNKDNLMWSDEPVPEEFSLPFINLDKCPRSNKHSGTLKDAGGRLRCAHISRTEMTEGFIASSGKYFDAHSGTDYSCLYEDEPTDPSYVDDDGDIQLSDEWDSYIKRKAEYDDAKPVSVVDVCYSIIKEPEHVMSLEKMLRRLNISPNRETVYCSRDLLGPCIRLDELDKFDREHYETFEHCLGHAQDARYVTVPFCGWTLAWYAQKWHQQCADAPFFMQKGERDEFKMFPDFQVYSSED